MSVPEQVLDAMRAEVGSAHVVTDPAVTAGYEVDWTGRFRGAASAVVRPGTVEEVATILRLCTAANLAVVPQGGNTGLVGGSVPLHGEVVLSLRRLDGLGEVDERAGQVTAQAGVTLARLQGHARAHGWEYPVDLGARESATVGGTLATNAGGVHVLRHGATRRQVVGVQAVLPDGALVDRLDGLEKDNTGYDLAGLLCGSEGTLAVITAARLRLVPRPVHVVTALLAFDDLEDALDAAGTLRRELDSLWASELFLHECLELVCERLGLARPFAGAHRAYLLVECAARTDPIDELGGVVSTLRELADAVVTADLLRARGLWHYREALPEAINLLGAPHKLDVTLPPARLGAFCEQVVARVHDVAPAGRVWLFGHAADGNVHVNVTGVAPDDERVTDAVLRLAVEMRGSISAEHGIGAAKRQWLRLARSPAEIDAYRRIKHALDPGGILNPHVLLPERPPGP